MKLEDIAPQRRAYRQGARAEGAEATATKVIDAFLARAQTQWFDEITLDQLAQDAGVTVQTVIRRFNGKDGVVEAATEAFGKGVLNRREAAPGKIDQAVDGLIRDYEQAGYLVMRILAQEDRYPTLKKVADFGRAGHRQWITEVFAPWIDRLPAKAKQARIDGLVAAMDLYLWRLIRVDIGRDVASYRALVMRLIAGALEGLEKEEPKKAKGQKEAGK